MLNAPRSEDSDIVFKAIIGAGVLLMVMGIALGVQQGKENEECRKGGGTPVKTDHGYTCMKGKP